MNNSFQIFNELHKSPEPLLIGNVWDVPSARAFEAAGYKAIATSSAAVAETLGYQDGEQMPFEAYLFMIGHIAKATSLPFSVDLEAGYGKTAADIVAHIIALYELGVCGINIEDSVVMSENRTITDTDMFARKIRAVISGLSEKGIEMFINLRSDVFLLKLPGGLTEAQKRIERYQQTGAHGLFFPGVTKIDEIAALTKMSALPVNVMAMPGLPDFTALQKAGVKRISMGPFIHKHLHTELGKCIAMVNTGNSFQHIWETLP